jgi:hypothetical protein
MSTTEQTEQRREPRTETMLDGSMIQYITISPTGVRVFRKGGGYIDVTNSDPRKGLHVEFSNTEPV